MNLGTNFKDRKSLGEDVFDYLKNAIIDQTIEPGSRLVESRIAKTLGISRTPLREALHKLEREDWIEKMPNGGFQVVDLTLDDIIQTFGIRSVLESYAARLATENFDDKTLALFEKKLKEYRERLKQDPDSESLQKINTEFHDMLYEMSRNPKLIKMINQLRAQISRYRHILLKHQAYAAKSHDDHVEMFEAIKQRDSEKVEKLVREHINSGKNMVLEQLRKEQSLKK